MLVTFLVALVLSASVSLALYFYFQYQQTAKQLETKTASGSEIEKAIAAVSKLMSLPSDEIPTFATVSDKTKLQQTAFFQKAENGDQVLIYNKAQKAILYRPSVNKIIDVSPIKPAP